jgi:L-lactate dehydrogenase complex protein LldG
MARAWRKPPEREEAVMTPENRTRMQAVLNKALRQAYLPGSVHGSAHGAATASHGGPAATGTVREGAALTAAGTPATAMGAGAGLDPDALTARFCEELEALAGVTYRVKDVHAAADQVVNIVARSEAPGGASGQPRARGQTRQILGWNIEEIGVPGLAAALSVRGIVLAPPEVPFEDPDRAERLGPLAELSVGLTGAHAAIAESGSIVLASGPGRGRLASLLTPLHIAILRRDRIVRTLEDIFAQRPELPTMGSNCVIITGPSRTADIEMTLSRGVHGPREIHVIIV